MKNKEIAKITGVSESYVSKVRAKLITAGDKVDIISALFDIELHIRDIIKDDRFWEICEVAIAKSRSIEVRKYAVRCQHLSEIIRREASNQNNDVN